MFYERFVSRMFRQFSNTDLIYYAIITVIANYVIKNEAFKNSVNGNLETKIVGGKPVPLESFPSTVKFYNFGALCSGTIINSWCILTAAHCFDHNKDVSDMIIEVGARYINDITGELYEVLNFVIHKEYNKVTPFACDIAVIFVTRPIKLGNKTKKALVVNDTQWMKPTAKNIVVSGWGWTKYGGTLSELGLMGTHLNFVTSEDCERMHQLRLTPDMFCLYGAGARDTCKGDSGGGVMWNDMVIGVVSHGDGCAKEGKPSVYANVWHFRDWIRTQVENFFQNACKMLETRGN